MIPFLLRGTIPVLIIELFIQQWRILSLSETREEKELFMGEESLKLGNFT